MDAKDSNEPGRNQPEDKDKNYNIDDEEKDMEGGCNREKRQSGAGKKAHY